MAKKVVNVALHKKKPIKPMIKKGRKLKAMLKRFTHYMKTDSYMYSLLESTKPSSASSGKRFYEPIIKKKERSWLQGVEEFLKCDCYMYSPLCDGSVSGDSAKVSGFKQIEDTSRIRIHDQTQKTTPQSKPIAFRHVVERETVKRVVLQNGGSDVTGNEILQEELDTTGAKRT